MQIHLIDTETPECKDQYSDRQGTSFDEQGNWFRTQMSQRALELEPQGCRGDGFAHITSSRCRSGKWVIATSAILQLGVVSRL